MAFSSFSPVPKPRDLSQNREQNFVKLACVLSLFVLCLSKVVCMHGVSDGEGGVHWCLCNWPTCAGQNALLQMGQVTHFVVRKCTEPHVVMPHFSWLASGHARLRGGSAVAAVAMLLWFVDGPDCCLWG